MDLEFGVRNFSQISCFTVQETPEHSDKLCHGMAKVTIIRIGQHLLLQPLDNEMVNSVSFID